MDHRTEVAVACQGGGSHSAVAAGVLAELGSQLSADGGYELVGLSGTSGGAMAAALAWYGHVHPDRAPRELLAAFWEDLAADDPVDRAANQLTQWEIAMSRLGVSLPEVSPYLDPGASWGQAALRRALERRIDFASIPSLLDGTQPAVLVSAVDVESGAARVFREDELSADVLLASAAEPRIFPAVEIDGRHYWDGLFAKNPPVKDFVSRADLTSPDELWVVSISPEDRDGVPRTGTEIANRRTELAGNLALSAEVSFVERINDWIEAGYLPSSYTHTEIHQLPFPRPELDWRTSMDRDADFVAELVADGEALARSFLEERAEPATEPPVRT